MVADHDQDNLRHVNLKSQEYDYEDNLIFTANPYLYVHVLPHG